MRDIDALGYETEVPDKAQKPPRKRHKKHERKDRRQPSGEKQHMENNTQTQDIPNAGTGTTEEKKPSEFMAKAKGAAKATGGAAQEYAAKPFVYGFFGGLGACTAGLLGYKGAKKFNWL